MLRDCPECGKSASDTAELCPHCGYRLLGRGNLVLCRKCRVEVIPEANAHDAVRRYCPYCTRPVTGVWVTRVFFTVVFLMIVAVLIYILRAHGDFLWSLL